jgi:4a-hydroxytetrahydrobiopterin dehydratase
MNQSCDLKTRHCQACEGGVPALSSTETQALLAQLQDWQLDNGQLTKRYRFKDHYQTMAFVNALAWISHREDHRPDLHVGWGDCVVRYSTHAIKGLSENDFICAAKVDALFDI